MGSPSAWFVSLTASQFVTVREQRWLGVVVIVTLVVRLSAIVQENTRLAGELRRQARHDHLTGLPNRAALSSVVGRLEDGPAGLLVVDLDRFKAVNDTLGHAAGDELLVLVAERLKVAAGPGWTVYRLGGDEIVCLSGELVSEPT